jgi:hypothetical protein
MVFAGVAVEQLSVKELRPVTGMPSLGREAAVEFHPPIFTGISACRKEALSPIGELVVVETRNASGGAIGTEFWDRAATCRDFWAACISFCKGNFESSASAALAGSPAKPDRTLVSLEASLVGLEASFGLLGGKAVSEPACLDTASVALAMGCQVRCRPNATSGTDLSGMSLGVEYKVVILVVREQSAAS